MIGEPSYYSAILFSSFLPPFVRSFFVEGWKVLFAAQCIALAIRGVSSTRKLKEVVFNRTEMQTRLLLIHTYVCTKVTKE